MYHKTSYSSGHTLYSEHIERPLREFEIQWFAPSKRVPCHDGYGLEYEASIRWAKVLAETEGGAIKIAEYHYWDGSDFKRRENNQPNEVNGQVSGNN